MTPTGSERQRTSRYVLESEQKKTGSLTPYDKATPDKKKQLEREAIIANVITGNKRKVCEDRGIPLDIFTKLWEEYRETRMFDGRFFHRMEVNPAAESENVTNMKSAIAEYYRNGNRVRAQGLKIGDGEDVWQKYNVAKTSFYDAIKWERDHPAKKWDGDRIRQRGKISLLTLDMESELLHWIAISQKHSGGVDPHAVCRVAFALMASDPEHHARVKKVMHLSPFQPLCYRLFPYPFPLLYRNILSTTRGISEKPFPYAGFIGLKHVILIT